MEDVKNHTKFELVTRVQRFERLVADPCYKCHNVVNENLVGVERAKDKVYLGKPMSGGCGCSGPLYASRAQLLLQCPAAYAKGELQARFY